MSSPEDLPIRTPADLQEAITRTVSETPAVDMHTHLFSPGFGDLLLRGVDELVTYHYLIAEALRADRSMAPEAFFALSKPQQADHIWRALFLDRSPVSEAQRGVLTTLTAFGLDVGARDLGQIRRFFEDLTAEQHVDTVLRLANVEQVVMTNDPFDPAEYAVWQRGGPEDERFAAALRLDGLLLGWEQAAARLRGWGYDATAGVEGATQAEVRRFLGEWLDRTRALYMAVSLPDTFRFPEPSPCGTLLAQCVLPVAAERGVPCALMIGVKRAVNPALKLAGDGVGKADTGAVERLCADYPQARFLVTMLSRENQHELCVAARKFPNLMPFGCWWFLNDPSLVEEITRMRLELLGLSFIPQHSDARVLDQLVYKWKHSRDILRRVLVDKYRDLMATGWRLTRGDIERDVRALLADNFRQFVGHL
jgi:hypothetical protein